MIDDSNDRCVCENGENLVKGGRSGGVWLKEAEVRVVSLGKSGFRGQ